MWLSSLVVKLHRAYGIVPSRFGSRFALEKRNCPRITVMSPPGLVKFVAVGPPRGLAALVANHAVVGPIAGRRLAGDVVDAALSVVPQWRARVDALADLRWPEARTSGGRKWRMLNCPPCGIAVVPQTLSCYLAGICPHCWGRAAVEQWANLDAKLFGASDSRGRSRRRRTGGPRRLSGFAVARRTLVVDAPFKDSAGRPTLPVLLDKRIAGFAAAGPDHPADALPGRRYDLDALKAAGVAGGLEVVRFRPVPLPRRPEEDADPARPPDGWRVEVDQLLVIPTASLASFLADPAASPACLARAVEPREEPTRGDLAVMVARCFRYPAHLIRGPSCFAFASLRARKGRRLSTRFGSCYGKPE